jgi:hypothetical protein
MSMSQATPSEYRPQVGGETVPHWLLLLVNPYRFMTSDGKSVAIPGGSVRMLAYRVSVGSVYGRVTVASTSVP